MTVDTALQSPKPRRRTDTRITTSALNGEWSTRRITLDFDRGPAHWRPPLDALRAVYNLRALALLDGYRLDATQKGVHLVCYLSQSVDYETSLRLREMFGDDSLRVGLDSFRPAYAAGVLWSRKGSFHVRKGERRESPLDFP